MTLASGPESFEARLSVSAIVADVARSCADTGAVTATVTTAMATSPLPARDMRLRNEHDGPPTTLVANAERQRYYLQHLVQRIRG